MNLPFRFYIRGKTKILDSPKCRRPFSFPLSIQAFRQQFIKKYSVRHVKDFTAIIAGSNVLSVIEISGENLSGPF
jgi:hypothetical protein